MCVRLWRWLAGSLRAWPTTQHTPVALRAEDLAAEAVGVPLLVYGVLDVRPEALGMCVVEGDNIRVCKLCDGCLSGQGGCNAPASRSRSRTSSRMCRAASCSPCRRRYPWRSGRPTRPCSPSPCAAPSPYAEAPAPRSVRCTSQVNMNICVTGRSHQSANREPVGAFDPSRLDFTRGLPPTLNCVGVSTLAQSSSDLVLESAGVAARFVAGSGCVGWDGVEEAC